MINENESNSNNLRMLEVNEEIESLKKSKETRAYILYVFTQIIWTIQGLQLKSFFSLYSSIYDLNSLVFWRHSGIALASYLIMRYKKINLKYPYQIQHRI